MTFRPPSTVLSRISRKTKYRPRVLQWLIVPLPDLFNKPRGQFTDPNSFSRLGVFSSPFKSVYVSIFRFVSHESSSHPNRGPFPCRVKTKGSKWVRTIYNQKDSTWLDSGIVGGGGSHSQTSLSITTLTSTHPNHFESPTITIPQ